MRRLFIAIATAVVAALLLVGFAETADARKGARGKSHGRPAGRGSAGKRYGKHHAYKAYRKHGYGNRHSGRREGHRGHRPHPKGRHFVGRPKYDGGRGGYGGNRGHRRYMIDRGHYGGSGGGSGGGPVNVSNLVQIAIDFAAKQRDDDDRDYLIEDPERKTKVVYNRKVCVCKDPDEAAALIRLQNQCERDGGEWISYREDKSLKLYERCGVKRQSIPQKSGLLAPEVFKSVR